MKKRTFLIHAACLLDVVADGKRDGGRTGLQRLVVKDGRETRACKVVRASRLSRKVETMLVGILPGVDQHEGRS